MREAAASVAASAWRSCRRGGDALVGQTLGLRGRGGGAGGGLLLRRLFRRPRPFRLLHLSAGCRGPSAAARRRRG